MASHLPLSTSIQHPHPHPLPQASGAGSTRVIPSPAGFWISSHWNPQPEPATPDLFFTPFPQQSHAIHVCLHVEQRQEYMWMCMCLREMGALCSRSPGKTYILSRNFIENSGLIRPSQAKLSWYTDVLCFMSVPCSLFWADPDYCIFELKEHIQRELLTLQLLAVSFHFVARSQPLCSNANVTSKRQSVFVRPA